MALKWCCSLIARQAVNEVLKDVNFQTGFTKGHAAVGNQSKYNPFVVIKQRIHQRRGKKRPQRKVHARFSIVKQILYLKN